MRLHHHYKQFAKFTHRTKLKYIIMHLNLLHKQNLIRLTNFIDDT